MIKLKDIGDFEAIPQIVIDIINGNLIWCIRLNLLLCV